MDRQLTLILIKVIAFLRGFLFLHTDTLKGHYYVTDGFSVYRTTVNMREDSVPIVFVS